METPVLNMRHVPVSDARSFNSNCYPSGRCPKVSIGIMVDKTPNMVSGARKEGKVTLPARERVPSFHGKMLDGHGGFKKEANTGEKQAEPEDMNNVVWVSSRSAHHETTATQIDQCFVNQTSILQSEEGVHKKSVSLNYEKRKTQVGDVERVEEAAFSALKEVHVLDKERDRENTENVAKANNESLRMKLWEILGSVPSQNKQILNPPVLEEDATSPITKKVTEHQNVGIAKTKQNSDTIETDSVSPDNAVTVRRPTTRSLTRKKDPIKLLPSLKPVNTNGRKQSFASGSKEKFGEKNVFSFDDKGGGVGGLSWALNGTSSAMTRKRSNRNTSKVEPRRISFPRKSASAKTLQSTEKEKPHSVAVDTMLNGNAVGTTTLSPSKDIRRIQHQANAISENVSQISKTGCQVSLGNPPLEKYVDTHEHHDTSPSMMSTGLVNCMKRSPLSEDAVGNKNIGSPPSSRNTQPLDCLQSPTLAVNITPAALKKKSSEQFCGSPLPEERRSSARKPSDSTSSLNSRPVSFDSDDYLEASDHTRCSSESPIPKMTPPVKDKVAEKHCSQSQRKDSDSESLEADDITNKGFRAEKWFSDPGSPKISPVSLHKNKKLRSLEDLDIRNFSPHSTAVFGTSRIEEANCSMEVPDTLPEDGLSRSISQLALVLERFKAKLKSHTNRKNSEILSSVGDKIRLQLQDVESKIQADVGKFTSLAKSKRKRLESTFQEQQEKLKAIHEKFKEEVNQHFLDCRGTLEDQEAFHMGMKANAERQRASHRKLLKQVEEAMEVQLSDAETSIAVIHQVARKKMNGLKHVLREWLNEATPS